MTIRNRAWLPYFFYSLLSTAVLGPLLFPGYILNLDMVFGPSTELTYRLYGLNEWWVSASAPFYWFIQSASNIIPSWLLQKAILVAILFLAGLGAHQLCPLKEVGSYFSGIVFMINPYTYVRFLSGQFETLAAYALIPFAIKAFIELLAKGSMRDAIRVAFLSTLVGMFHLHELFLLFLSFVVIVLVKAAREGRERGRIGQPLKYVIMSGGVYLFLNLYWLIPALTAKGTIITQISRPDLLFFAPIPTSSVGIMFDLASMHGFWRGGYIYVKDIVPFWWVLFTFILFLVVYGVICNYKGQQGWLVVSFGVIGMVSFVLGVGAASDFTRPLFEWLWEHVWFFRGFRDSHRFVALICLCYSYLGGLGIQELIHGLRGQK